MSRPAWLGLEPVGARAELAVLTALLIPAVAYVELGHPLPPHLLGAIADRLERLALLLPLELGVPV